MRPANDWACIAMLLEGATFPAALWSGAELRFMWMNRAFIDLTDDARPQYDLLGMPVRGFLSDTRSAVRFIDAAYTGQALTVPEYEYKAPWGETTYWQLSYLPLPGRIGDPFDVLLTAVDVTDHVSSRLSAERERDGLHSAMGLINRTILSSLDGDEILQRVLVEATEVLKADWGWIAERDDGSWVFRNVHGWPAEMIGLRFAEDDLSLPALASSSRAVVCATLSRADSQELALMERHDIGAFLMVPIMHRGEVTAVMGFCWDTEVEFTHAMVELAEQLAVSLSLALENARQFENERRINRTLQAAFFTAPALVPGLELGHLYHSASVGTHVGGDFYDVIPFEGGRTGLVMGDVSGRGMEVAALTALVKSAMRAEALRLPAPGDVLEHANEIVLKGASSTEFVSAFFGTLDGGSGHLSYALAGHPSPILVRSGKEPVLLADQQMLLGVQPGIRYVPSEITLDIGDLLVLYTDGLVDAGTRGGERYGTDRLLEAVCVCADQPAEEVPESLFLSAFSFAEGHLADDVAILAVRRTGIVEAGDQGRLELAGVA